MYSLYRAWFENENYPHLETVSSPDTVVRVGNDGEHQFVAHRGVLAAHSGYLKALLATTSSNSNNNGESNPITSVSVPSIGGEAFAALLNYMYTGHLEVTGENIYSVLLATHLLHMPGALEQCRAALLRVRGPPPPIPTPTTSSSGSTVLRPVPNRLVGPPICWSQSSFYPSTSIGFPLLPNIQLPPRIPVLTNNSTIISEASSAYNFRNISPEPLLSRASEKSQKYRGRSTSPKIVASTSSKLKDNKERFKVGKSEKQEVKKIRKHSPSFQSNLKLSRESSHRESTSLASLESSSHPKQTEKNFTSNNDPSSISPGVVLDIACCDGPVKFHRVLNENYTSSTSGIVNKRLSQGCPSSSTDSEVTGENDENGKPDKRLENDGSSVGSSEASGNYRCKYCGHTFKSYYCYKKHARRHLLPTGTDGDVNRRPDNGRRREVRLLDLNVQYYPCKICGSKFPSYYFVHKHKKLCHSAMEIISSEGEDNQNIDVAGSSTNS